MRYYEMMCATHRVLYFGDKPSEVIGNRVWVNRDRKYHQKQPVSKSVFHSSWLYSSALTRAIFMGIENNELAN